MKTPQGDLCLHDDKAILIHIVKMEWSQGEGPGGAWTYTFFCGQQTTSSSGKFGEGSFDPPTCILCIAKADAHYARYRF